MSSILPGDDELLSDDELATLERAMESVDPTCVEFNSLQRAEYRSAFEFVEELAAPIRTAIELLDSPPILEDYDELIEIARGGMGVVYRGLHKKTRRYDAVKVMRPDRLASSANATASLLRLQFLRESQLAARVAHEHIVPVYQVGESGDRPWFSMQFVDGSSLYELTKDSTISPERVVRYIEQIARAVDVVHRHGILHGDIKPQNILIEVHTDRPMISDFGLADLDAASTTTSDAGIAGTPAYMAPELAHAAINGRTTDDIIATRTVSSDVYSLGATLWAALSRCSPCFENRLPREQLADVAAGKLRFNEEINREIPPALKRIIQRCVSPAPATRFSTAGELAEALAQWLDRPHWNRHFPKLRKLLCIVVAPVLFISGLSVQLLLSMDVADHWIWLVVFAGYAPLFATFLASQRMGHGARQAHRELWSIWLGHLCASISGMVVLHILCQPNVGRSFEFFYPFWAAISSLVFFAKSGNFWSGYRWVGVAWSLIAVWMALTVWAPVLFGALAATTCFIIARMDRSFLDD
jgi:tRNA A-37 threonylcarbamoyl transferase component Bud32